MFKDVFVLLSLLCLTQLGEANLAVATNEFTYNEVIMSDTTTYHVVTLIIDFDQDVYVKTPTTTASFDSFRGKNILSSGEGVATLACTGPAWFQSAPTTDTSPDDGPPLNMMVSPGVETPFSAMLSAFGGYSFNETRSSKRWAAVLILEGGDSSEPNNYMEIASRDEFEACKPKLTFSGSGTNSLADSAGNVFAGDVSFDGKQTELLCTKAAVVTVHERFDVFLALPIESEKQLEQIEASVGSILGLPGYSKCIEKASNLVTFVDKSVPLTTRRCVAKRGTIAWTEDACCNPTLRQTQCCATRNVEDTISVLNGTATDVINRHCGHPTIVKEMLQAFILVEQKAEEARKNKDRRAKHLIWDELTTFVHKCKDDVEHKRCNSDNDCYSKQCDTDRTQCVVHYDKQEEAWAMCVWEKASDAMLEQGTVDLGLNASVADMIAWTEQAAPKLKDAFTGDTCVGPNAWDHKERFDHVEDEDGNWNLVLLPGNETECLEERNCNFDPWYNENQASCTGQAQYLRLCFFDDDVNVTSINVSDGNNTLPINSLTDANGQAVTLPMAVSLNAGASICVDIDLGSSAKVVEMTLDTGDGGVGAFLLAASDDGTFSDMSAKNPNTYDRNSYSYNYENAFPKDTVLLSSLKKNGTGVVTKLVPDEEYFCGKCEAGGANCEDITVQSGCYINRFGSPCSEAGADWAEVRGRGMCMNPLLNKAQCQAFFIANWEEGRMNDEASCLGITCSNGWLNQQECEDDNSGYCTDHCFDFNDDHKSCNKTECLDPAQGHCEFDWDIFYDSVSDVFKDYICVSPYTFHATEGYQLECDNATNSNFIRNAHVGCVTSHATESACTAFHPAAKWVALPTTEAQCNALPSACDEEGEVQTLKSAADCEACGGNVGHSPQWRAGEWRTPTWGAATNHYWKKRGWASSNQWKTNVFSSAKFQQGIQELAAQVMGRQEFNQIRKQYGERLTILKDLACDCTEGTPDENNGCFDEIVQPVEVEKCIGEGAQTCDGTKISCPGTTCTVTTSTLPAYKVANNVRNVAEAAGARRRLGSAAGSEYDIIGNTAGEIIGQLIGPAKKVTATAGMDKIFKLCMDINPDISIKSKYTTFDFATGSAGTPTDGGILNVTVTSTGQKVCGTVTGFTSPGIYFPIKRVDDYDTTGTPGAGGGTTGAPGAGGGTTGAPGAGTGDDLNTYDADKESGAPAYVPVLSLLLVLPFL